MLYSFAGDPRDYVSFKIRFTISTNWNTYSN